MNYKIVIDEKAVKNFINWLPELRNNEKFYCSLFARKKYSSDLIKSNDKTQLKRFLATKENLLNKLRQLEIKEGYWQLKDQVAPQESLVCYIMPNPRDMIKATKSLGKKCFDLLENKGFNLHAEAMSCIQKSKSRTCYVDFDIDDKEADFSILDNIFLDSSMYSILQTRGGYHLLIDIWKIKNSKEMNLTQKKNWYTEIINNFEVDQCTDQMIPIPGCVQGGFVPKFIEL